MNFDGTEIDVQGDPKESYYSNYQKLGIFWDEVANSIADEIVKSDKPILLLDIGANIGLTTLYIAARCQGDSEPIEVHLFEPSPDAYFYLLKNLKQAPHSINAKPNNLACGSADGVIGFAVLPESTGSYIVKDIASPHPSFNESEVIQVKVTRLDQYVKSIGLDKYASIFVKLDVEGFELDVLDGATMLCMDGRASWFIEFNPWFISQVKGVDPATFLSDILNRFNHVKPCNELTIHGFSGDLKMTNIDEFINCIPSGAVVDLLCKNIY